MDLEERRREHRKSVRLRLRELRKERDWTQEKLAERFAEVLGKDATLTDQRVVSEYEREKSRRDIGLEDVELFAEAFGVSPLTFLGSLLGLEHSLSAGEAEALRANELQALMDRRVAGFRARLNRPAVETFLDQAVKAADCLSDAELDYEARRFRAWAEQHQSAPKHEGPFASVDVDIRPLQEAFDALDSRDEERSDEP